MSMGIEAFSLLVAIALAVFSVGVVALLFGQCVMMTRLRRPWWVGLIPGYNLYVLFSAAHCQVLFALYLVDAAFVYAFWTFPNPEDQELIWWPLLIGVFMVMWMSLCLAGRMRLGFFWRLLAFLFPSYAWCLMGLLPRHVDPDFYPWSVQPFLWFERLIFRRPKKRPSEEEEWADGIETVSDGDELVGAEAETEFVGDAEWMGAQEIEVVGETPEPDVVSAEKEYETQEIRPAEKMMVANEIDRSGDAEVREVNEAETPDQELDQESGRAQEAEESVEAQESPERLEDQSGRELPDAHERQEDVPEAEDALADDAFATDELAADALAAKRTEAISPKSEMAEDAEDTTEPEIFESWETEPLDPARSDVSVTTVSAPVAQTQELGGPEVDSLPEDESFSREEQLEDYGVERYLNQKRGSRRGKKRGRRRARRSERKAGRQAARRSSTIKNANPLQTTQAFVPLQEKTRAFDPIDQSTQQLEFIGTPSQRESLEKTARSPYVDGARVQEERPKVAREQRATREFSRPSETQSLDRSDRFERSSQQTRSLNSRSEQRRASRSQRSPKQASQRSREGQNERPDEARNEDPELTHYIGSSEFVANEPRDKGYAVSDERANELPQSQESFNDQEPQEAQKAKTRPSNGQSKAEPREVSKPVASSVQQVTQDEGLVGGVSAGPQPGDRAYSGSEFDPVGDARAEVDRRSRELSRRLHELLSEEDELLEEEYLEDSNPYDRAFAPREPMSDLSDEIEGQIEGVFAEQLGMPEVTQDVDAEEAAYIEEDAAFAREQILEETHDDPDAQGYSGKHLAQAVREMEEASGEQRFRSKGGNSEEMERDDTL